MKKTITKTDRAVMERKRKALTAMADNEDWLEGKAAVKKPKAT